MASIGSRPDASCTGIYGQGTTHRDNDRRDAPVCVESIVERGRRDWDLPIPFSPHLIITSDFMASFIIGSKMLKIHMIATSKAHHHHKNETQRGEHCKGEAQENEEKLEIAIVLYEL